MMRNWQLFFLICCLSSLASFCYGAEKWSRQLEPGQLSDSDSSLDWIPLAQPTEGAGGSSKDRSENGRVLTYSQTFPPNARFGEYAKPQSAPLSQHQSFQDFPYQFQRYPNAPLKSNIQQQEPTSQSFFKFEMPFHNEGGRLPGAQPSLQTGYQIQHSFNGGPGQATLYSSQLYNQQPLYNDNYHHVPQKSLNAQPLHRKPSIPQQNYIDESLPIKSPFRESKPVSQLQNLAPQAFPLHPKPESLFEVNKPSSLQIPPQYQPGPAPNAAPQQEEVQLVYVPYDSYLNRQQQKQQQQYKQQQQQQQLSTLEENPAFELNRFNLSPGLPAVNPYQINQFYTQEPLGPQEPNYYTSSTTSRPKTTPANPSNIFQNFVTPQFTTPKPKPKAHQPPLAMFLMRKSARPSQSDVVTTLRNSENIAVIDAPTKEAPDVFVGPAGMPIPEGYVKFDLPYLSQLSQTRSLNEVPFFVAPLSYRTPNGFNKILLPEPHVGSIVINRAKDNAAIVSQATYAPSQSTNEYPTTTQHTRVHNRIKQPSSSKDFYPELLREPNIRNQQQFEVTTQRASIPTRGHKFSYYIDQVESTQPKIKQNRPKKKRPQTVTVEQPDYSQIQGNQYEPFNAIPNEDFYKIQTSKAPASTSTSTTSTSTTSTTTSTTTPAPSTYFPYNSNPQVEFHSSNGQLYPSYNTVPSSQIPEHTPRFTTRPPPSTAEEEHRMKQYFRQQDAFRNRPQINNPTYSPFEQVQYTPIEVSIPSTTVKPGKQRFTFYTPMDTTSSPNIYNTLPPQETSEIILPQNHRPSYNPNEISDGNAEYEPNPYQLPSELPQLTPNLPGQVNDLQENNKAHSQSVVENTTPLYEAETTTRPTRRPINRTRKPVVSKVTSSVSYSESESSGKRPTNRVRRPYGSRGNSNVDENFEVAEETVTTTRRPSTGIRNTSLRNPNRIRYQPTPEERQSLRTKQKKGSKGSNKSTPAEDLEYQRDVLKQNYPVFRPGSSSSSSSRKPTSPTAIPSSYIVSSTKGATSETQQVYTVTPSNEQVFPAGMLEPMQIAQHYNRYSKENYGPGYFPNQEDLNPTEPVRNEVNPVYTASTTPSTTTNSPTTTESIQTTTRRSLFVRRNYPKLRPTTTEIPPTTTQAPEEKTTTRSRIPPRKVIKVRTRNRRPLHPASSTSNTPEEESEPEPVKNSYRKVNRFNQDLYERDTPKRRYKTQFHLEGQESQWSPSVKEDGKDNFSPIELKDTTNKSTHDFQNEPEIVTIGPENKQKDSETYEISVSAEYDSKKKNTSFRGPNLKPEKSFAELLEEVMGKAPDERPLSEESTSTTRTTDGTYFESQKTTIGNLINRRGKWKKLRAQAATAQNDSFEAAESQNIGEQLLNKIYEDRDKLAEKLKTTTPLTPEEQTSMPISTVTEYSTVNNLESFATIQPETTTTPLFMDKQKITTISSETDAQQSTQESATRRLDMDVGTARTPAEDLDSQPSIFSEVKRQLHDLFAIDDSEDQAVTAALAAVKRNKEYTSIKRTRPPPTTTEVSPIDEITATAKTATESIISATTPGAKFHKNLMDHLVYSTSTSTDTKVSSETEICYRGRCIRTEDLPSNHKLQ